MNKKKVLDSFLNLLNGEENSNNKKELNSRVSEELFIKNIHLENTEKSKTSVPENFMDLILQKAVKQKSVKNSFFKKESFKQFFFFRPVPAFAVSVIFSILLITMFWTFKINFRQDVIQLSSINSYENKSIVAKKGTTFYGKGIEIKALKNGEIAQDLNTADKNLLSRFSKSKTDDSMNNKLVKNIYFKKGKWHVKTHHEQLEMETWFHFPGGGIRPIGTAFKIKIEGQKTLVQLTEGKIESYTSDKNGNITGTTIESAPFNKIYESKEIMENNKTNQKNANQLNDKLFPYNTESDTNKIQKHDAKTINQLPDFEDKINTADDFSNDFMEKEPEEDFSEDHGE